MYNFLVLNLEKIKNSKNLNIISFLLILGIACFLRFQTLSWDQGHTLHPDERFLVMVTSSMKIPASFVEYLNQSVSLFNPANLNFKFFVYGIFPLVISKLLAVKLDLDQYGNITYVGRFLSGFFDIVTFFLVYFTVLRLGRFTSFFSSKVVAILAALLYGLFVLPIQLSHFYATDTFANTFMFASFFLLLIQFEISSIFFFVIATILSALFISMAIASKISAIFIIPLLVVTAVFSTLWKERKMSFFSLLLCNGLLYMLVTYIGVRLFDPYLFENPSLLDPRPSKLFLSNIEQLKSFGGANNTFPPNVQWISKTKIIFPLKNIIFAGVGFPLFLFIVWGSVLLIREIYASIRANMILSWRYIKKEDIFLLSILGWIGAFFLYQGSQWVPSMRYFMVLYPFFALLGSVGVYDALNRTFNINSKNLRKLTLVLLPISIFIWPYMFTSIYERKHTRVLASEWIWKNIPDGSALAYEHWDDALPLQIQGMNTKKFEGIEIPIFPQDNPTKWKDLTPKFDKADYYIMSSNRAWGTIPLVPRLYPETTKFYEDLFNDRYKNYKLVQVFESYPKACLFTDKLCIVMPDLWIEEAFSVYDHPKVMIYKNFSK